MQWPSIARGVEEQSQPKYVRDSSRSKKIAKYSKGPMSELWESCENKL